MAKKIRLTQRLVEKLFKASPLSPRLKGRLRRTYTKKMAKPYRMALRVPFFASPDPLRKKLIVIGIIGKVHGKNKAANPPRIPNPNADHTLNLSSRLLQSTIG